jgi:hypothetical protein
MAYPNTIICSEQTHHQRMKKWFVSTTFELPSFIILLLVINILNLYTIYFVSPRMDIGEPKIQPRFWPIWSHGRQEAGNLRERERERERDVAINHRNTTKQVEINGPREWEINKPPNCIQYKNQLNTSGGKINFSQNWGLVPNQISDDQSTKFISQNHRRKAIYKWEREITVPPVFHFFFFLLVMVSHEAAWWAWTWPCDEGNNLGLAGSDNVLEVVVLVDGLVVVVVVATRSQEGHMVRVVAGSCM